MSYMLTLQNIDEGITCLKLIVHPPFLNAVGVASLRSESSLAFSFLRSPSRAFLTLLSTSCLSFRALQSSTLYGGEMMTASWTIISC